MNIPPSKITKVINPPHFKRGVVLLKGTFLLKDTLYQCEELIKFPHSVRVWFLKDIYLMFMCNCFTQSK